MLASDVDTVQRAIKKSILAAVYVIVLASCQHGSGEPGGHAYLRTGDAELAQGNVLAAYENYQRALALMPENRVVRVRFADLAVALHFDPPGPPPEIHEAVRTIAEDLLADDSVSADGLRLRAELALADDRPATAILDLERALTRSPDDPRVAAPLCGLLLAHGREKDGEQLCRELVRNHSTLGPPYDTLYQYYIASQRLADAEAILRLKWQSNPDENRFGVDLAAHYARQQDWPAARRTLEALLTASDRSGEAWLDVGDFYSRFGEWKQALRAYEEGARLDPRRELTFHKRIILGLLARAEVAEAKTRLTQLIRQHPEDAELHSILGMLETLRQPSFRS